MKNDYLNTGRTNQKLQTRNKILKGARHFLNKGKDFSLEDLATQTGISRATIYRYFSHVDLVSAEAVLEVSISSPEELYDNIKEASLKEQILEVQKYYNTLSIDREQAFRKYIGITLNSTTHKQKRGARRKIALDMVFAKTDFTATEKEDLSNLLTILMGMEPLIVTKDVCGLDNEKSHDLMRWGAELILEGFMARKSS